MVDSVFVHTDSPYTMIVSHNQRVGMRKAGRDLLNHLGFWSVGERPTQGHHLQYSVDQGESLVIKVLRFSFIIGHLAMTTGIQEG